MRKLAGALIAIASGCHGSSSETMPDALGLDAAQVDATAADAAPDADPTTAPIVATADQWSWVDFPDSKCASGTPTGIAVNPHAGATDLIIYMEGGGHCSTGESCWGSTPQATFLDGYGSAEFAQYGLPSYAILDRDNTANPLRTASMVFVPYCTGDLHVGTREIDLQVDGIPKPTYFWGASDLDVFLARIVPTFPNVQHIWIVGVSAGGFASFLSFDPIARAFGSARVDILDDSGPPILAYNATMNGELAYWGFQKPATCSGNCDTYAEVVAAARATQPASRIGYLLYEQDSTLWSAFAYPTIQAYGSAIDAFAAGLSDPHQATFIVTNKQDHVVEHDPTIDPEDLPWITKMVTDDPTWASTTYAYP